MNLKTEVILRKTERPVQIELNYKEGEKIKVSPVGQVIGFDGRTFNIDGESLVESIKNNQVDIALEEGHWNGPAMGWFAYNSFEARDDGIYASLELTPKGKQLVEDKSYRYLSPAYYMGENRVVTGLDSMGLVNKPNLLTKALNERQTEDKVNLEELQKLKEENEKTIKSLKETNEALSKQLEEIQAKFKETVIARAIDKNEILPNQKDFAMSLDEDGLAKFIETNKQAVEYLKKKTEHEDNSSNVDEETLSFATKLGLTPEQVEKYVEKE